MFGYYKMPFSINEVEILITTDQALRADDGGLVLGRSHDEGGIYFLVRYGDQYLLDGEIEGYEYIINQGAAHQCRNIFKTINNHEAHKTTAFGEYVPSMGIKILDTRKSPDPKYLVFESGGFGIVNKFSTKGYLNSINQLNYNIICEQINSTEGKIVYRSETPIDLYFYNNFEGTITRKVVLNDFNNSCVPQTTKKGFWENLFSRK